VKINGLLNIFRLWSACGCAELLNLRNIAKFCGERPKFFMMMRSFSGAERLNYPDFLPQDSRDASFRSLSWFMATHSWP
jgi:hypothetical protein